MEIPKNLFLAVLKSDSYDNHLDFPARLRQQVGNLRNTNETM
jgi:hypothetical protein